MDVQAPSNSPRRAAQVLAPNSTLVSVHDSIDTILDTAFSGSGSCPQYGRVQTAESDWQSSPSARSWTAAAITPQSDVYHYSHSEGSWETSPHPRLTPESDGTSSFPRNHAAHNPLDPLATTEQGHYVLSNNSLTQAVNWRPQVVQAGVIMSQTPPSAWSAQHQILRCRTSRVQQQRYRSIRPHDQAERDPKTPVDCLTTDLAAINAAPSVPSKLKRKRNMSPARNAKAKQMRREGPCVRCRMYKEGVRMLCPMLRRC